MQKLLLHRGYLWAGLATAALLIGLATYLAPAERTLGEGARLVYLHGAWVWTGKITFGLSALTGLLGLVSGKSRWQELSLALGRTGLFFWLTYLPMSLWVQQMNWGGIFWDEPRWRIPLMFGIVGLLMQTGLWLIENLRLASGANLAFGVLLWLMLGNAQNVLHPDSPIFQSNAVNIQLSFILLAALSISFGALLTCLFLPAERRTTIRIKH